MYSQVTRRLKASRSSNVKVSALAITGMIFTHLSSFFINSRSRGFNLLMNIKNKKKEVRIKNNREFATPATEQKNVCHVRKESPNFIFVLGYLLFIYCHLIF